MSPLHRIQTEPFLKHKFRYITNTKVNSALHRFGVGKLSTGVFGWQWRHFSKSLGGLIYLLGVF